MPESAKNPKKNMKSNSVPANLRLANVNTFGQRGSLLAFQLPVDIEKDTLPLHMPVSLKSIPHFSQHKPYLNKNWFWLWFLELELCREG